MFLNNYRSHYAKATRDKLQAFTLIELLVVIVIIGILATLATVALTSSRANARDARRISDLKQISLALELYQADNNSYPTVITPGSALTNSTNTKTYIAKVPSNPAPRAEGACGDSEYQYAGSASDYSLIGCLAKGTGDASAGARVVSIAGARNLGPTNGIVGWWLMDSNYLTSDNKVGDLSGNANHGTINGGATLTANQLGQANEGYNFDGVSTRYIKMTNGTDLNEVAPFTLSAWVQSTKNSSTLPQGIISRANLSGSELGYFLMKGVDQKFYFGVRIFSIPRLDNTAHSNVVYIDNIWHHLVGVVLADGAHYIYVDGVKQTANSAPGVYTPATSTMSVCVGGAYSDLTTNVSYVEKFVGSISDVRIYNRALSQDEVAALWNATRP